jgi:hypothetical protein
MIIYHQISNKAWRLVKYSGLVPTSRGEKGARQDIVATDVFLDKHVPTNLKIQGLSRDNNLYGYLGTTNSLIDIQTGAIQPISQKAAEPGKTLLRLNVNPVNCWISDLDLYDVVKAALAADRDPIHVANEYWKALCRLDEYDNTKKRPEIMITYKIEPIYIQKV